MKNNLIRIAENLIFEMVQTIKSFNQALIDKFELNDSPYNSSGKKFPKTGVIDIDKERIEYRWHGRGCTFHKNRHPYYFSFDISSKKNPIILTPGGIHCFFESYWVVYKKEDYSKEIDNWLQELEVLGIFMKRKKGEHIFHVNEVWFQARQLGVVFDKASNTLTDWL